MVVFSSRTARAVPREFTSMLGFPGLKAHRRESAVRTRSVGEGEPANARGLSVIAISKRFGKVIALQDVSLNVAPGEVVGLFGRDGAGKTVCFEAIMGLTKIDSGRVLLDGKDITRPTVDRRGPLGLSYLSQQPSIFGGMTTAENIRAVLEHCEPDPQLQEQRLASLLAQFNIEYVRDTRAARLSGGEQKRCEIARAMAAVPSVMLLDEPFAGLDPFSVDSIGTAITTLRRMGVGILMSDQNVRAMIGIVDHTYVLHMGRIVFAGPPETMVRDADVRRVYLGDKYPSIDVHGRQAFASRRAVSLSLSKQGDETCESMMQ